MTIHPGLCQSKRTLLTQRNGPPMSIGVGSQRRASGSSALYPNALRWRKDSSMEGISSHERPVLGHYLSKKWQGKSGKSNKMQQ